MPAELQAPWLKDFTVNLNQSRILATVEANREDHYMGAIVLESGEPAS
jgi:hypothetical protein